MNEMTKIRVEDFESSIAFIGAVRILRERCESVAPPSAEFYWTFTTLQKLLKGYPTETKFRMKQRGIILEDIRAYFSELVFDPEISEPMWNSSHCPPKDITNAWTTCMTSTHIKGRCNKNCGSKLRTLNLKTPHQPLSEGPMNN